MAMDGQAREAALRSPQPCVRLHVIGPRWPPLLERLSAQLCAAPPRGLPAMVKGGGVLCRCSAHPFSVSYPEELESCRCTGSMWPRRHAQAAPSQPSARGAKITAMTLWKPSSGSLRSCL